MYIYITYVHITINSYVHVYVHKRMPGFVVDVGMCVLKCSRLYS